MNKRMINSRKKRKSASAGSRRMLTTVNLLMAVVAVIECLMLVVFATYSWIESTSSLIISTGEDGEQSMNVGKNLNYQVELAADSAVAADMQTYYHTIKYFRFAKSSSPDGETMYFPKTNATNTANTSDKGYTNVSGKYRKGDTADYNISYTYFDFKLKNSTAKLKYFYFKPNLTVFSATGGTSSTIDTNVANAMRISFKEGNAEAKIFSIGGGTTQAVNDVNGTPTPVTSRTIASHTYNTNDTQQSDTDYVVQAAANSTAEVSVRIWLEEKALDNAVTPDELKKIKVKINLSLVSDNVAYDQIYFDDYSYSDNPYYKGRHTTDIPGEYSMYLFAYNATTESYIAYPMTQIANTDDSSIPRWATSAPVKAVLSHLNTSDGNAKYFNQAFFGYGKAPTDGITANSDGSHANLPDQPLYMWKLPGAFSLRPDPEDPINSQVLSSSTQHIAAYGIARAKAMYLENESPQGFCVFLDPENPQTDPNRAEAVRFHDYATGLTGVSYNQNAPAGKTNFRYITASNKSTSYVPGQSESQNASLYYFDLPTNAAKAVFNNNGNSQNQTEDIDLSGFNGGTCYKCVTRYQESSKQTAVIDEDITGLPAGSSGRRIYFNNAIGWSDVRIYIFDSSNNPIGENWTGSKMTEYVPEAPAGSEGTVTYMNYNMYITGASDAAATKAVNMIYDSANAYYKAYVPHSWLDGNMYFKYYKDGYYRVDSGSTDKYSIMWTSTGNGGGNVRDYYALGYEGTATVDGIGSGTNATGAGTWTSVRLITLSTELIDANINPNSVYYVSADNQHYYPMYPEPGLLKFSAYVPEGNNIWFKRKTPNENDNIWGGQNGLSVTANDEIFYPVSLTKGYFHVAVLVDGTFDHLVTKIRTEVDGESPGAQGNTDPESNISSTLTYSLNSQTAQSLFANPLGNNRWYVPCDSDNDIVTFTWTPYHYTGQNAPADTVFTYTMRPQDGIYYIITE